MYSTPQTYFRDEQDIYDGGCTIIQHSLLARTDMIMFKLLRARESLKHFRDTIDRVVLRVIDKVDGVG